MPSSTWSTYAILIDFQRGKCGANAFCVHARGTIAYLRRFAGRTHNGTAAPWPKAQFDCEEVEPISMRHPNGSPLEGVIALMTFRPSLPSAFKAIES